MSREAVMNRAGGWLPQRRRRETCADAWDPDSSLWSIAGMILPLQVTFDVRTIEVHVSQIARAVPHRLIAEMRRRWVPAFAAGGDGPCAHAIAEFDNGDEA